MKKRKLTPKQVATLGGKALAAKMTPRQRSMAARKAARARWANQPKREA